MSESQPLPKRGDKLEVILFKGAKSNASNRSDVYDSYTRGENQTVGQGSCVLGYVVAATHGSLILSQEMSQNGIPGGRFIEIYFEACMSSRVLP